MSETTGNAAQESDNRELSARDFEGITDRLRNSIKRERKVAAIAGTAALIGAGIVIWLLIKLAGSGVETIRVAATAPNKSELPAITIFLLIRGTALAAVVSGVLYAIIGIARSALDQATRFDKRLIAASFINFAVHTEHVDVDKMRIALKVLEAWGASVESAYTPPRVAAKRAEAFKIAAGKDGFSAEHNLSQPTP